MNPTIESPILYDLQTVERLVQSAASNIAAGDLDEADADMGHAVALLGALRARS